MGLFSSRTPEQKQAAAAAVQRYRAARAAADDNAARERRAGVREETERYYELNDELAGAMDDPALPWHAKLWT